MNAIRYSDEFKQQIVNPYNSGQSALEPSYEYGVTTVTIYKWIRQYSLAVYEAASAIYKVNFLCLSS
jgi:transposase-like protein